MEKEQKQQLTKWLKSQSHLGKKWLYFTVGVSFVSGLLLLVQAASLAHILHQLIIEKTNKSELLVPFALLGFSVLARAICGYYKEKNAYLIGEAVRVNTRQLLQDKLGRLGAATIQIKPAGSWATLLLEQVEDLQDFFSRYLPQLAIAGLIPIIILAAVFPLNWAAGLILLVTAPLIPFFMALVGKQAADANRKNLKALHRLSGHFLDRLKGLNTIKLFAQGKNESLYLHQASDLFRKRTMEVLRLAFLSSAVLEFFTALSIALTAVYFGFSYLGELNFGHYGIEVTLFTGLFILLLAPDFYQPLRELGSFYHAKSQAIAAAESIVAFLNLPEPKDNIKENKQTITQAISIEASELVVLSPKGKALTEPMSFSIAAGEKVAIIGKSGSGKTSLLNAMLGFLPYQGSLKIAGIELNELCSNDWREHISWVSQNPKLFHGSIKENIVLSQPHASNSEILKVAKEANAYEFISKVDSGFNYKIGDNAHGLSVGQAQRIALARALLRDGKCWFLDEPTASLDSNSESLIMASLNQAVKNKTTIWVTHKTEMLNQCSQIFVLQKGKMLMQGSFEQLKQSGLFDEQMQPNGACTHA